MALTNVLVEATPTSGPQWVMNARSDSRTNEDSGTLQITKDPAIP